MLHPVLSYCPAASIPFAKFAATSVFSQTCGLLSPRFHFSGKGVLVSAIMENHPKRMPAELVGGPFDGAVVHSDSCVIRCPGVVDGRAYVAVYGLVYESERVPSVTPEGNYRFAFERYD